MQRILFSLKIYNLEGGKMLTKRDIEYCDDIIEILDKMSKMIKKYKFSGNKNDIELLEIYTKNLLRELLICWF